MEIRINRYRVRGVACDGVLMIDNVYVCDTAENASYMPPEGEYGIELRHSKVHGRKVPVLINLETGKALKEGFCLAMGNGVYNRRDGRILLGTIIVPGCLKNSRESFMKLYDRIKKAQSRGKVVTIKIRGPLNPP